MALHEELETAISHAVGQIFTHEVSVSRAAPRDGDGDHHGDRQRIYDVEIRVGDAEKRKKITVEVRKRSGIWVAEPLVDGA